jgi:hypothetical protein
LLACRTYKKGVSKLIPDFAQTNLSFVTIILALQTEELRKQNAAIKILSNLGLIISPPHVYLYTNRSLAQSSPITGKR